MFNYDLTEFYFSEKEWEAAQRKAAEEAKAARNFKCPYCNEEIEIDDRIDFDVDSDYVQCKMIGHCLCCERQYIWYEQYKYEKSFGFAEEE